MELKPRKHLRNEAVGRLDANRDKIYDTYGVVAAALGTEHLPETDEGHLNFQEIIDGVIDLLADDDDDDLWRQLAMLKCQLYDEFGLDNVLDYEANRWKAKYVGRPYDAFRTAIGPIREACDLERENAELVDLLRDAAKDYRDAYDHAHAACSARLRANATRRLASLAEENEKLRSLVYLMHDDLTGLLNASPGGSLGWNILCDWARYDRRDLADREETMLGLGLEV